VLERTDLGRLLGPPERGKVRDIYRLGDDRLVLVATDRISAFDRVLGTVPHKGEVLTALSAWWFDRLAPVVANHLLAVPDPNVSVVLACRPLPVEVVVRGYLTGVTSTSLWPRYEAGERVLYGIELPDGLAFNDPLPAPIVTPTTKAPAGQHDEPLSGTDVVARGLVDAERWAEVLAAALGLFSAGSDACSAVGLTLVDTKYEFGIDADGRLRLIDEAHTPDSSRFWRAGTGEHLDKELLRRHYVAAGYRGEGEPPALSPELAATLAAVYVEAFERLSGRTFVPADEPAEPRIEANLRRFLDAP
jgi:phosphoribosylaminoimidazole-succinocarboxamide synthase